jgi:hypothetical protein
MPPLENTRNIGIISACHEKVVDVEVMVRVI